MIRLESIPPPLHDFITARGHHDWKKAVLNPYFKCKEPYSKGEHFKYRSHNLDFYVNRATYWTSLRHQSENGTHTFIQNTHCPLLMYATEKAIVGYRGKRSTEILRQQAVEFIQILLRLPGINVNKSAKNGHTPLMMACSAGDVELVRLLLAMPTIDVNKGTKCRRGTRFHVDSFPLFEAVRCGHIDVVRLLLSAPSLDVNKRNVFRLSALGLILNQQYFEEASETDAAVLALLKEHPGAHHTNTYIVEAKSTMDIWHPYTYTLYAEPQEVALGYELMEAVSHGNTRRVRLFLDCHDIDLNYVVDFNTIVEACWKVLRRTEPVMPRNGRSLIHYSEERAMLLWRALRGNNYTPSLEHSLREMHYVLFGNRGPPGSDDFNVALRKLILTVPDGEHVRFGDTPLSRAFAQNNHLLVRMLLRHPRINVNCMNARGEPLLYDAIRSGEEDIVRSFLSNPTVDVSLPAVENGDNDDQTVIEAAQWEEEDADPFRRLPATTTIKSVAKRTGNARMIEIIEAVPNIKRPYASHRAVTTEEFGTRLGEMSRSDFCKNFYEAASSGDDSQVCLMLPHLQGKPARVVQRTKYIAALSAYTNDKFELGNMILRSGVDNKYLNSITKRGSSLFHILCGKPYSDIIPFVLSHGLSVNNPTQTFLSGGRGFTPLGFAAICDNQKTVEALLAVPMCNLVAEQDNKGREIKSKVPPYCDGLIQKAKVKRTVLPCLTQLCMFGRTRRGTPLRQLPTELEQIIASFLIPDPAGCVIDEAEQEERLRCDAAELAVLEFAYWEEDIEEVYIDRWYEEALEEEDYIVQEREEAYVNSVDDGEDFDAWERRRDREAYIDQEEYEAGAIHWEIYCEEEAAYYFSYIQQETGYSCWEEWEKSHYFEEDLPAELALLEEDC